MLVPSHYYRMRVFGRDLIRGGHYGQWSCEPQLKAEHMAALTNAAKRGKKLLPTRSASGGIAEVTLRGAFRAAFDPAEPLTLAKVAIWARQLRANVANTGSTNLKSGPIHPFRINEIDR